MIVNPSKETFVKTWFPGYMENWAVYGQVAKISEEDFVSKCLKPFYNKDHVALEIGCGGGFWTEKYLSPNFKEIIALDLLPDPKMKGDNIRYIEVPEDNFLCHGVDPESVDFVWSFGVFCHLTIPSIQKYVKSCFKKLRAGGKAVLYFSNIERRPNTASSENTRDSILWVENDMAKTKKMMWLAGFSNVVDLIPELCDTMMYGEKK